MLPQKEYALGEVFALCELLYTFEIYAENLFHGNFRLGVFEGWGKHLLRSVCLNCIQLKAARLFKFSCLQVVRFTWSGVFFAGFFLPG